MLDTGWRAAVLLYARISRSSRSPGILLVNGIVGLTLLGAWMVGMVAWIDLTSLPFWPRPTGPWEILAPLGLVTGFIIFQVGLRFYSGKYRPHYHRSIMVAYLPLALGAWLAVWLGTEDYAHRRLVGFIAWGACVGFTILVGLFISHIYRQGSLSRFIRWLTALAVVGTWSSTAVLFAATLRPQNAVDWQHLEIAGVIIHHAPGQPIDPQLLKEIPRTFQAVEDLWRDQFTRPDHLPIYIFPDEELLNQVAHALDQGDVLGLFDSGGTNGILFSAGTWKETGPTLAHEYCHALNNQRYGGLTGILDEGMARFTEQALAKQLRFPPEESVEIPSGTLDELFSDTTFYRVDPQYAFAGGFVAALVKAHGVDAFHLFCERVKAYSTEDGNLDAARDAFHKTYHGTLDDFVDQWRMPPPLIHKPAKTRTSGRIHRP